MLFRSHWSRPDGVYFLTFRTADSLPRDVALALREREIWEYEQLGRQPSADETRKIRTNRHRATEKYLNEGHGACLLRHPEVARIASDAIRFFDGQRYRLHVWCVMPNHVHVLLTIFGETPPTEIAASWKQYSSRRINALFGTSGAFWQEEGFDHIVRGPNSFDRFLRYVWDNPVKAGLKDWVWTGGDGNRPELWPAENP